MKARILYILMAFSAVLFATVDVIAEFDGDDETKTATYHVKRLKRKNAAGFGLVLLGCLWLGLHFLVDRFPL